MLGIPDLRPYNVSNVARNRCILQTVEDSNDSSKFTDIEASHGNKHSLEALDIKTGYTDKSMFLLMIVKAVVTGVVPGRIHLL